MENAVRKDVQFVLISETCCKCGVIFGVGEGYQKARRSDKATFYCPNGHSQYYPGPGEVERLRAKLDEQTRIATQQVDRTRAAESYAHKVEEINRMKVGQIKSMKARAKAGVCPCCHRTVSQMADHITTKHPEYKA